MILSCGNTQASLELRGVAGTANGGAVLSFTDGAGGYVSKIEGIRNGSHH